MVNEGRGRLLRRKDGKYLIYLPLDLAKDSMFPFKGSDSIFVKVSFKLGDDRLLIEEWEGTEKRPARAIQPRVSRKRCLRTLLQNRTQGIIES